MFKRSTTSECGVTQHTTTTIQYERYNTDGAKICSRKQRTKYDRRYDEEANRARRRGSVSGKPERHTRENFHTHYNSSPLKSFPFNSIHFDSIQIQRVEFTSTHRGIDCSIEPPYYYYIWLRSSTHPDGLLRADYVERGR